MENANEHQTIIARRQLFSIAEGAGLLSLSCPLLLWSFGAMAFDGLSGLWAVFLLPVIWSLIEIVRLLIGFKSPRQRIHGSLRRLTLSLIAAVVVVWGVHYPGVLTSQLSWFLLGTIPVSASAFYHLMHRHLPESVA